MGAFAISSDAGDGGEDVNEKMADMFGPGHVGQMIRQGVQSLLERSSKAAAKRRGAGEADQAHRRSRSARLSRGQRTVRPNKVNARIKHIAYHRNSGRRSSSFSKSPSRSSGRRSTNTCTALTRR